MTHRRLEVQTGLGTVLTERYPGVWVAGAIGHHTFDEGVEFVALFGSHDEHSAGEAVAEGAGTLRVVWLQGEDGPFLLLRALRTPPGAEDRRRGPVNSRTGWLMS